MKTLTLTGTMPENFVTRQQLIDAIESLAADSNFVDGATIVVIGGKIAVGSIAMAKVSGLQEALDGLQGGSDLLDALAGSSGEGLVRRMADESVQILPVSALAALLLTDATSGAMRARIEAHPAMAQGAAVADVDDAALPAEGAIAALGFSSSPTQGECQALRDACENLRDVVAATITTLETLRGRFRQTSGNGLLADS